MVDRVGAPYRVLLYQPGIRFIHLSNSKGLCLQQRRGLYKIEEGNYPSHSTLATLYTIRSYSSQYGLCCEVIVYLVCIVVANIGVVQVYLLSSEL